MENSHVKGRVDHLACIYQTISISGANLYRRRSTGPMDDYAATSKVQGTGRGVLALKRSRLILGEGVPTKREVNSDR